MENIDITSVLISEILSLAHEQRVELLAIIKNHPEMFETEMEASDPLTA